MHHTEVFSVLLFSFFILVFTSVSVGDGMENNCLKIYTGSSVAELMQPRVQAIKSALKLTQLHLSGVVQTTCFSYTLRVTRAATNTVPEIIQGRENHVTERTHISKINSFN